jgi:hypothetical protein
MSVNLPSHYVMQYASTINLLLQQKGSKLRDKVMIGSHIGKQASPVDQIGAVEAQRVTSRFSAMGRVDAAVSRRWVAPVSYDLPQLVDHFDKLKLMNDPQSAFVQNAVFAMGRAMDREIIAAFMGSALTGETGSSTTSFTAANEVDVATGGSNSRLNVAKLRAVRELIKAAHIDMDEDPIYVGLTAKDDAALLNEIEIISTDFAAAEKPVLVDGKLKQFLGMNFVHCELLETLAAGTNEVNIPVWAKSGMHLGMWEDVKTSVSQRHDLQGEPWQVYVSGTFGATRIDESKVFNIESYRA